MKRSNSIKIGARIYEVHFIDDEEFAIALRARGHHDDVNIKSFIDYDSQLIILRDRLSDDHKSELLMHELLHACLEDSGLCVNIDAEPFIRALAPRLNQLLRDRVFDGLL